MQMIEDCISFFFYDFDKRKILKVIKKRNHIFDFIIFIFLRWERDNKNKLSHIIKIFTFFQLKEIRTKSKILTKRDFFYFSLLLSREIIK